VISARKVSPVPKESEVREVDRDLSAITVHLGRRAKRLANSMICKKRILTLGIKLNKLMKFQIN